MDFKRSKTRSYGEASQSSRHSVSSPSPNSGSRPLFKDRVKSAPPAAQSSRHQNARPQRTKPDLPSSELEAPGWPSIHQPSSVPILEETNSDQPIATNFDQVIPFFIQLTLLKQKVLVILANEMLQIEIKREIPTITLAVIGASRAGKSTFVQCALDLKKSGVPPSSIKKVSLEGVVSVLRLLEIQLEDVGILENRTVDWPSSVGDLDTPKIDGVLVLCDVMDGSSMADVVDLLSKLKVIFSDLITNEFDRNPMFIAALIQALCITLSTVMASNYAHIFCTFVRIMLQRCNPNRSDFFKMRQPSQGLAGKSANG